jgi:hypothetical protein
LIAADFDTGVGVGTVAFLAGGFDPEATTGRGVGDGNLEGAFRRSFMPLGNAAGAEFIIFPNP